MIALSHHIRVPIAGSGKRVFPPSTLAIATLKKTRATQGPAPETCGRERRAVGVKGRSRQHLLARELWLSRVTIAAPKAATEAVTTHLSREDRVRS